MKSNFETRSDTLADTVMSEYLNTNEEQTQQVLAGYLFGCLNGLAQELNATPGDVQGKVIGVLVRVWDYPQGKAAELTQFLINSTDESYHPTMFAIIHRGLEGYYLIRNKKYAELTADIQVIVKAVKEAS
ncbi:Imm48 family immunity protein [uncultured Lacticaseibacillus sp.]|jgi:hypothetical protein|uniref:Imm48 family immunity protein n=1 Tax=uncultured Lacticaseibacillus sp. TaxID=2775882 RepID=UPI0025980D20|nr:Imm48 family immunity protein [uncultured Lacticaseibacillus sp.]